METQWASQSNHWVLNNEIVGCVNGHFACQVLRLDGGGQFENTTLLIIKNRSSENNIMWFIQSFIKIMKSCLSDLNRTPQWQENKKAILSGCP